MIVKLKALTLTAVLLSLASCITTTALSDTLTDAELIKIAETHDGDYSQDKRVIGTHNGNSVIEEFHCSDLCPENTTRIVHYEVPEQATCESIGGVTKSILVPIAITVMPREYCFPKVIAPYWHSAE